MTASVSDSQPAAAGSRHTGLRIVVALLGVATFAFGVVLLANPVKAANTLALLVGIAFLLGGLLEIAAGSQTGSRSGSVALGGILIIGGLAAMLWPGVTVWSIALITGLALIAHGIGRIALAVAARHEVRGWPWLALAGGLGVLFGFLALIWPEATVLVLCLVLGAQVTAFGVLITVASFLPYGTTSKVPAGA